MDDLIAYSNNMVLIVCFTNTILIKKKNKNKNKKKRYSTKLPRNV